MKKKVENARRFGSNRHIEFGGAVYSAAKTAAAVSSWLVPTIVSTPLPINFTRTGTTVIGLEIIFVARTPPRFGPRIVFNYQLHPLPQLYAIQHRVQLLFLWPWFRVDAACFSNNCAENESEGGREEGRVENACRFRAKRTTGSTRDWQSVNCEASYPRWSKRSEVKRELIGKNDGGITIKERSNEASA